VAKIVKPDFERATRCGIPEVVYGGGKSAQQICGIAARFLSKSGRMIATKVSPEKAEAVAAKFKGVKLSYDCLSEVLILGRNKPRRGRRGTVGILTAGTSDVGVAEEARIILEELGLKPETSYDVGVAGVHRLFPALKKMAKARALIVVAGMEGALPSVVSGLVDVPVIGVPTSVGYGVGRGGLAALNAMLSSCSPVAVVNIDNGYGAAILAYQIVRT
jgi:NCAIR mutase (PurE)-related protein